MVVVTLFVPGNGKRNEPWKFVLNCFFLVPNTCSFPSQGICLFPSSAQQHSWEQISPWKWGGRMLSRAIVWSVLPTGGWEPATKQQVLIYSIFSMVWYPEDGKEYGSSNQQRYWKWPWGSQGAAEQMQFQHLLYCPSAAACVRLNLSNNTCLQQDTHINNPLHYLEVTHIQ